MKDGRFETSMEVPAKLPWPNLILRIYAANEREEGMAVRTLSCKRRLTGGIDHESSLSSRRRFV